MKPVGYDCVACCAKADVCYVTSGEIGMCPMCAEMILASAEATRMTATAKSIHTGIRFQVATRHVCVVCSEHSHMYIRAAVCLRCMYELRCSRCGDLPRKQKIMRMAGADSDPNSSHNDSK